MIGERVGDWAIDAEMWRDHRGPAFRARGDADPTRVATVRVFSGPACQTPEFHALFRGRLAVLRRLAHPNIVAYLGGGVVHGEPYYVAEHVDGVDYQALLRDGKRPDWPAVLAAGLQIASALRHAHRRGVLHGDLTPANVIRTADGSVKLAEMGVAKLFGVEVPTYGDNPLASAAFLSPEQLAGKPGTKRSDFYALGCLLYALLTGRPPFVAANVVELIHKQCFAVPERPARYLPELPAEFDALVMRLLEKDPQNRPGSGTLLLAELDRVWASPGARGQLPARPSLPVDDAVPEMVEIPDAPARPRAPDRPYRPLMNRPGAVVPAFALFVAIVMAGVYLSRETAESLYSKAEPLMRSDDPADWETAWNDYLEPLSRRFPDQHAEEVRSFRARAEPLGELRRAQTAGKAARYAGEAERFYAAGLRLCQAGDFAGAKRVWERVVVAFGGVESETHWVAQARQAAARVTPQTGALHRPTAAGLQAALAHASALHAAGDKAAADAAWDALEMLYRDDADAAEILALIRKDRGPKANPEP